MAHLTVAALVITGAVADISPDPRSLEVSAADRAKARALVRRLASPIYQDRDEATTQLRGMGRLALAALTRSAATDPDAEVRFRCENLIPAATAEDFDARLAVFLADTAGQYEHNLPGWAKFRKLTGKDPLARKLFAELLQSEPNRALIAAMGQDKAELERRVLARRYELYTRMYQRGLPAGIVPMERYEPTLVDAAGLLFAETLIDDKPVPRGAIRMVTPYTLLMRTGLRSSFTTEPLGPVVKKLTIAWMETRTTALSLSQVLTLASQVQPETVGRYAGRLIAAPGVTAIQRANAAATIARTGDRKNLSALVPLFEDTAVIRVMPVTGTRMIELQVRDVALTQAIQLTGRDPADFGLETQSNGFSYLNYAFPDEATRAKALAKWAELEPKLTPKK